MEDDTTRDLSFSDKLDQILSRLNALEAKTYDTRPIWERALAEIIEIKAEVLGIKNENAEIKTEIRRQGHKFEIFVQHLISAQVDVKDLEERLSRIEGNQPQG